MSMMKLLKASLVAHLEAMKTKVDTTREEESRVAALVFLNMALQHVNKETSEAKMGTCQMEANRRIVHRLLECALDCYNHNASPEIAYLARSAELLCR